MNIPQPKLTLTELQKLVHADLTILFAQSEEISPELGYHSSSHVSGPS